jgi:hypothetical protein
MDKQKNKYKKSKPIYPIFENCFACKENKKSCKILIDVECMIKGSCKFYKTQEQFDRDVKKLPEVYVQKYPSYEND